MSKLSQETHYLASILAYTVVKCICHNISCALGKWSLHSRWNLSRLSLSLHVHGNERWPTEVTILPLLISSAQQPEFSSKVSAPSLWLILWQLETTIPFFDFSQSPMLSSPWVFQASMQWVQFICQIFCNAFSAFSCNQGVELVRFCCVTAAMLSAICDN